MRKFIVKAAVYFVIVLMIITGIIFYIRSGTPASFWFVSNSPSHNFKVGFIKKNLNKLKTSKIVILGSSMSLNNINAVMIQDSFHSSTINLASWGLKLSNYKNSDIWDENKILISNMQFPDFGKSKVSLKDGFGFDVSRTTEFFNIFRDFKTYLDVRKFAKYIVKTTNTDYDYCGFDECGSVLLSDSNFVVKPNRWIKDDYILGKIDSAVLANFVTELKETIASHKKNNKIIITFSPARRAFYNRERSNMVLRFGRMLREQCPDVVFINNYDLNYPDNLFVDFCHFNTTGANKFTNGIIDSIKKRKVIN